MVGRNEQENTIISSVEWMQCIVSWAFNGVLHQITVVVRDQVLKRGNINRKEREIMWNGETAAVRRSNLAVSNEAQLAITGGTVSDQNMEEERELGPITLTGVAQWRGWL